MCHSGHVLGASDVLIVTEVLNKGKILRIGKFCSSYFFCNRSQVSCLVLSMSLGSLGYKSNYTTQFTLLTDVFICVVAN